MAKKKAPKKEKETPKVNKDLEGFDIRINSFGEIVTSYDLDKINGFLDKNVDDKKLKNRADFLNKRNIEGEEGEYAAEYAHGHDFAEESFAHDEHDEHDEDRSHDDFDHGDEDFDHHDEDEDKI